MTRPPTTPFAEAVYARLAPVATEDERLGWPLLTYIDALSKMFERLEAVVRSGDGRAPYSPLLDVNVCPPFALPFLAQFVGVRLRAPNTGESLEDWAAYARSAISQRSGRQRGTPAAMLSAVAEVLTGTRSVRLLERAGGDAYALTVITRTTETPNTDVPMTNLVTNTTFAGGGGAVTGWDLTTGHGVVGGAVLSLPSQAPYGTVAQLVTDALDEGVRIAFGAVVAGQLYRALVPIRNVNGGALSAHIATSGGALGADGPAPSSAGGDWVLVPLTFTAPANDADARIVVKQSGAGSRTFRVGPPVAVQHTLTPVDVWPTGARPTTRFVIDAALTQKPAGIILTHTVSDFPLIDEGTAAINSATGVIDTATIDDVT